MIEKEEMFKDAKFEKELRLLDKKKKKKQKIIYLVGNSLLNHFS